MPRTYFEFANKFFKTYFFFNLWTRFENENFFFKFKIILWIKTIFDILNIFWKVVKNSNHNIPNKFRITGNFLKIPNYILKANIFWNTNIFSIFWTFFENTNNFLWKQTYLQICEQFWILYVFKICEILKKETEKGKKWKNKKETGKIKPKRK